MEQATASQLYAPIRPRNAVGNAAERDGLLRVNYPMTIRLRLTLWYTALLGATLILFSFVFYSALAANLWGQTQQDAARQASEVANALTQQLQFDILIIRNNPTRIQIPRPEISLCLRKIF